MYTNIQSKVFFILYRYVYYSCTYNSSTMYLINSLLHATFSCFITTSPFLLQSFYFHLLLLDFHLVLFDFLLLLGNSKFQLKIIIKKVIHSLYKVIISRIGTPHHRTARSDLIKGYTEHSMMPQMRPQHANKRKLNKCILKASVDSILQDIITCWTK